MNIRQQLAFYRQHGVFPYPMMGGDTNDNPSVTTTPDPHANPGGNGGQVVFKDQETFNALIANRIAQAKRSWETDERPKIVEDITKQVTDAIKADAERQAAEEAGEYKKLYEGVLSASEIEKLPKDSRLFAVLQSATDRINDAEKSVNALVADELKALPDAMKALLPAEYTPEKKLDWIRNAKKATGKTDDTLHGNNPADPSPSPVQGKTVEDVVKELVGRLPYGTGAHGRFAGAASNGGSQ